MPLAILRPARAARAENEKGRSLVALRSDPPCRRHFVSSYRLSLAHARLLDRLSLLQHIRILRGSRVHRATRRDGYAVLRRYRRHAGGFRRQSRSGRQVRRQVAAPRHGADDPADGESRARGRLRTHHVHDLSAPISCRARLQCLGPCHARTHRLERGDIRLQERSCELRLRRHDGSRRTLRARAGVPAGGLRALGQRRAGRPNRRPRQRDFLRSLEGAPHRPSWPLFQSPRPTAGVAVAAAAAGHHPGRVVGSGHEFGRHLRRSAIQHAPHRSPA